MRINDGLSAWAMNWLSGLMLGTRIRAQEELLRRAVLAYSSARSKLAVSIAAARAMEEW